MYMSDNTLLVKVLDIHQSEDELFDRTVLDLLYLGAVITTEELKRYQDVFETQVEKINSIIDSTIESNDGYALLPTKDGNVYILSVDVPDKDQLYIAVDLKPGHNQAEVLGVLEWQNYIVSKG